MSGNTITVDELTITPLKQDYKLIHPAIGTVNGTGFLGVWIPCMVATDKKSTVRNLLFLVTSDRRKIYANDTILREYGWRLEYKPTSFKNSWDLDAVEAFLNGADVDPSSVFDMVVQEWHRFLEFTDPRDYVYNALWDIGTYFHFLFSAYPYAYHGGSTQTGKSKALRLSSQIAFNAILSNNMSPASIFRLIQNARATLLLDETEKLSTRKMDNRVQEFRSILLSGYQRGGQAVYRVEKDKNEMQTVTPFNVYGPKRTANIEGLEDVIGNRCKITIHRRSVNNAIIKYEPDPEDPIWRTLRGQLCILFLQHWKEVKAIYDNLNPEELEGLDGREFELWRPIITMAKFFDSFSAQKSTSITSTLCAQTTLCSLMVKLAQDSAAQSKVENMTEANEAILLQVLLEGVLEDGYVSVAGIKTKVLAEFDDPPSFINSYWIGRTLKRLGFKDKRRVGTGYQYMLTVADIKDVAERMGIKPQAKVKDPQKTLTASEHSELSAHGEHVIEGHSETAEDGLIAAHCKKWHTGACPHPNPDCIVPVNPCPKTCGDFEEVSE
jgi:hypothetical protein